MKLAIMQPYLFPYLGYFQLIKAADKFVVYDDVAFIKQGWINRNQILVNQKSFMFSVPLADASSFRLIKDTPIHPRQYPHWRGKFLKTLTGAYSKAPYFAEVFGLAETVFDDPAEFIADLCRRSLESVCRYLQIETPFVYSEVFDNAHLKAQNRVIDICLREEAQTYINVPGGAELYDKAEFARNDINLYFIKPRLAPYKQFGENFISHLSIIDVLMFNSKAQARRMLEDFDLE